MAAHAGSSPNSDQIHSLRVRSPLSSDAPLCGCTIGQGHAPARISNSSTSRKTESSAWICAPQKERQRTPSGAYPVTECDVHPLGQQQVRQPQRDTDQHLFHIPAQQIRQRHFHRRGNISDPSDELRDPHLSHQVHAPHHCQKAGKERHHPQRRRKCEHVQA